MFRKQTRPKIVDMPRRDPSFQLSSKPSRPSRLQPHQRPAETPTAKTKALAVMTRPPRQPDHRPSPTPGSNSESVTVMPRRVTVSTCAREPFSLLRAILQERTKDLEPEKSYVSQIPVIAERREIHQLRPAPAFPGFKIHRLWKLKPGLYCLVGWDKASREILLRRNNFVFRTPLPNGVKEPPDNPMKTCLEIGRPEERNLRVSVKWVSV